MTLESDAITGKQYFKHHQQRTTYIRGLRLISKQSHWRWRNQVQLPDVDPIEGPVLNPPGLNLTLRKVEV